MPRHTYASLHRDMRPSGQSEHPGIAAPVVASGEFGRHLTRSAPLPKRVPRADELAAALYLRSVKRKREPEGFLEDAFAAALEQPEVWLRVRNLGGWLNLPAEQPRVQTQVRTELGRSDIWLAWPCGQVLVIELKPWHPPSEAQLARYRPFATHVTAVAAYGASLVESSPPMLAWHQLRRLHWDGEPLAWRQLHHLIDTIGALMPNIHRSAAAGLVGSWDTLDKIEVWTGPAISAACEALKRGGLTCVQREGREKRKLYRAHRYLGRWAWPLPYAKGEELEVFCGIFSGNARRATLHAGFPDMRVMVHLNPESPRARALWQDPAFCAGVERWKAKLGLVERQESQDWFYLLDARQPLDAILDADDHGAAFKSWVVARVGELADEGILARVAAVRAGA